MIERAHAHGDLFPAILLRIGIRLLAQFTAQLWMQNQLSEPVAKGGGIVIGHDVAGDPILNQEGQAANLRCNHRSAASHGFQGNHPKRFVM